MSASPGRVPKFRLADRQYEADIDGLRASFDRYGQIKTYFDLVKQRGMIFITYVSFTVVQYAD